MNRKLTASLLILAAVLANVAFTALGSIFNYPDVLDEPAGKVLADFRDARGRGQRVVLRAGALRRADGADRDRRRAALVRARDADRGAGRHRRGRRAGHRPAALADPRARLRGRRTTRDAFSTASDILGTAIGETIGYLLTATWTALVVSRSAGATPAAGSRCSALASAALVLSSAWSRRSICR